MRSAHPAQVSLRTSRAAADTPPHGFPRPRQIPPSPPAEPCQDPSPQPPSRQSPPQCESAAPHPTPRASCAAPPVNAATSSADRRRRPSRLLWLEHQSNGGRQPLPLCRLGLQLLTPQRRQRVILRPPVILRSPPFRFDPPAIFKTVQRRIQRALADLQRLARALLNPLRH